MRVLIHDNDGRLMVQECHSITAVDCVIPNNEQILKEDFGGIDAESFEGISGIHIMPTGSDMCEMFVPCEDAEEIVREAYYSGRVNLSHFERVYDAEDWEIY